MLQRFKRRSALLLPVLASLTLFGGGLTALALMYNLEANASDNSLEAVERRGYLRVGVDASIGGAYMFWNPTTEYYDGFEWDIAQQLAQQLGVQVRPVNIPWTDQLEALRRNRVDLVLSARERGSIANREFTDSQAYYRSPQRLLVRTEDAQKLTSLRSLVGKRLGVVADSGGAAVVETYNRNRGNAVRLFSSRDMERLLRLLTNRRIDAILIDEPVAAWQVQQSQGQRGARLAMVGRPLLPVDLVGVLESKDQALKAAVDRAIDRMRQVGTLKSILQQWNLWDSTSSTAPSESSAGSRNLTSLTTMPSWDFQSHRILLVSVNVT
ncbi:transporter substrate-binding domain-containing protein [Leptolyngbya sp. FACHB-261]|uniref:ABC transporter substrate-binding protein n=1 Tax=Leptolyngbya sp. FACHB-261 TaxID=2692806 RepID=UPI001F5578E0|nr:transporter substrate-binding domain-containing protein [Leptolyngbya sp. FACHB-261]